MNTNKKIKFGTNEFYDKTLIMRNSLLSYDIKNRGFTKKGVWYKINSKGELGKMNKKGGVDIIKILNK